MIDPVTMSLIQSAIGSGGGAAGGSAGGLGMPLGGGKDLPIGTGLVGAYNLITGIKQKRAADRMAYRSAEQGMGYVQSEMSEAQRRQNMGLSSQEKALAQGQIGQQSAQAYRNIAESSPSASSFFSRVAGMDRIKGGQMLSELDMRTKLAAGQQLSGARAQATNILQRSIQDERADKRMAQQAAGQAIASGISQLGTFINYAAAKDEENSGDSKKDGPKRAGLNKKDSAGNTYYKGLGKYKPGTAGMTDLVDDPTAYANMG